MRNFLELLDALCGHDNMVILGVRCMGISFSLVLHITGYKFIQEERILKLSTDSLDFGTIWFQGIKNVERGDLMADEPDYRFSFTGGQADMTFNLY